MSWCVVLNSFLNGLCHFRFHNAKKVARIIIKTLFLPSFHNTLGKESTWHLVSLTKFMLVEQMVG